MMLWTKESVNDYWEGHYGNIAVYLFDFDGEKRDLIITCQPDKDEDAIEIYSGNIENEDEIEAKEIVEEKLISIVNNFLHTLKNTLIQIEQCKTIIENSRI